MPTDREPTDEKLLPCEKCGAGEFYIRENRNPSIHMDGSGREIVSVEVLHWCATIEGQPHPGFWTCKGRDRASAIAHWNRRTPPSTVAALREALERISAWESGWRMEEADYIEAHPSNAGLSDHMKFRVPRQEQFEEAMRAVGVALAQSAKEGASDGK